MSNDGDAGKSDLSSAVAQFEPIQCSSTSFMLYGVIMGKGGANLNTLSHAAIYFSVFGYNRNHTRLPVDRIQGESSECMVLNFQVNNAWFYASLLRKTTCSKKPELGGT